MPHSLIQHNISLDKIMYYGYQIDHYQEINTKIVRCRTDVFLTNLMIRSIKRRLKMTLIRVDGAKLSMGEKLLFSDASFTINEHDKIGLVGHNGAGKSSLIKAIMGEIELDQGRIQKKKNLVIGYVPQDTDVSVKETTPHAFLLHSISPDLRDLDFWKVDAALTSMGLDYEAWHNPIKNLSGGWRRLISIAAADLKQPDLLILDEPTNHLDTVVMR